MDENWGGYGCKALENRVKGLMLMGVRSQFAVIFRKYGGKSRNNGGKFHRNDGKSSAFTRTGGFFPT
jgi:hypothetical protein